MYSYDRRTAGKVPFVEANIEKMRKDILLLMKNVDRIQTYQDANEFRAAIRHWHDWFEDEVYQKLVPNMTMAIRRWLTGKDEYNEYFSDQEKKWLDHWEAKVRKETWDLVIALMEVPVEIAELEAKYRETSEESARTSIMYKWEQGKKKWSEKVKREARGAWAVLKEFLDWLKARNVVPEKNDTEVLRNSIEGFDVVFIGYEGEEYTYHRKALESFKIGLRLYKQQAASNLPLLLRAQLPIFFKFDCGLDKGGEYKYDHIEVCASDHNPKKFVEILAHEMGHHLYKSYLSAPMAEFWSLAVRGDYDQALDLREVLKEWKPGEYLWDLEERLVETDPVMALQLQVIHHDYSRSYHALKNLETREKMEQYLHDGGDPMVVVPKHPITSYATKNTEEAFCETVGLSVAYGAKALDPLVLSWFKTILPSEVKIASVNKLRWKV